MNENEITTYQNLWDVSTVVLERICIAFDPQVPKKRIKPSNQQSHFASSETRTITVNQIQIKVEGNNRWKSMNWKIEKEQKIQ